MTRRLRLPWLEPDPLAPFPPTWSALPDPNGLLAAGGDLHPERLLNAYRRGIFPWYSEGEPILWWCPGPRAVFDTADYRPASRFLRSLRSSGWTVSADTDFDAVVAHCATTPRPGQDGTWIVDEMRHAYGVLHRLGHAHSIEVRAGDTLIGGLYGLSIGRMFYGESMFSLRSGGSKAALAALGLRLCEWEFPLIDCQVENPHLRSLGARLMPLTGFLGEVRRLTALPGRPGPWTMDFGLLDAATLAASMRSRAAI